MTESTVAIKPAEGCRLILPEGGTTLDGLGVPPDTDLPDEGAFVPIGVWARKRLDEGDAELVGDAAVQAGAAVAKKREDDAKAKATSAGKGKPAEPAASPPGSQGASA